MSALEVPLKYGLEAQLFCQPARHLYRHDLPFHTGWWKSCDDLGSCTWNQIFHDSDKMFENDNNSCQHCVSMCKYSLLSFMFAYTCMNSMLYTVWFVFLFQVTKGTSWSSGYPEQTLNSQHPRSPQVKDLFPMDRPPSAMCPLPCGTWHSFWPSGFATLYLDCFILALWSLLLIFSLLLTLLFKGVPGAVFTLGPRGLWIREPRFWRSGWRMLDKEKAEMLPVWFCLRNFTNRS